MSKRKIAPFAEFLAAIGGMAALFSTLFAVGCAYQERISEGDGLVAQGKYAEAIAEYQAAETAPQTFGDDQGDRAHARIRQAKLDWASSLAVRAEGLEKGGHPGGAWLFMAKAAQLDPKTVAYSAEAVRLRTRLRYWADYPVIASADDERARETLENLEKTLDRDATAHLVFTASAPARAVLRLAVSEPGFQQESHEEERTVSRGGRNGRNDSDGSRRMMVAGASAGSGAYGGFGAGLARVQSAQAPAFAANAAPDRPGGNPATILGNPLPMLGNALPTLGNALPLLGSPLPMMGSSLPTLGSPAPSALGSTPAVLGNALPTLENAIPALGNPAPDRGGSLPMLGSPVPRNSPAASASAGASIGSAALTPAIAGSRRTTGRNDVVIAQGNGWRPSNVPPRAAAPVAFPVTVRTLTGQWEVRGMIAHGDGRPPISIDLPVSAVGRAEGNGAQRAIGVAARPMEPIRPEMVEGFLVAQSTEAARRALDASFQSWRGAILASAEKAQEPEAKLDGYAVYALSDPAQVDAGVRERISRLGKAFAGIDNAAGIMTKH